MNWQIMDVIGSQKMRQNYVLQNKIVGAPSARVTLKKPILPTSFDVIAFEFWINVQSALSPAGDDLIKDNGAPPNNLVVKASPNTIDLKI